jgi:hypothetical protein
MATVAGDLAAFIADAAAHTLIPRQTSNGGKQLQVTHRRRPANARAHNFTKTIRLLSRTAWPSVPAPTKTEWKEPFGPAAYTRRDEVYGIRNGWTCFVMAHFGEVQQRGLYIESDPGEMPNALTSIELAAIDWNAQTATAVCDLHFYTTPGPETAIVLYQVNPKRIIGPDDRNWTRLVAIETDIEEETQQYQVPFNFAFPVRPGNELAILGRLRSTGGHSKGTFILEVRP